MRKTDTQSLNLEQGKDTKKDNLKELITNEIVKLSENFEHTCYPTPSSIGVIGL